MNFKKVRNCSPSCIILYDKEVPFKIYLNVNLVSKAINKCLEVAIWKLLFFGNTRNFWQGSGKKLVLLCSMRANTSALLYENLSIIFVSNCVIQVICFLCLRCEPLYVHRNIATYVFLRYFCTKANSYVMSFWFLPNECLHLLLFHHTADFLAWLLSSTI